MRRAISPVIAAWMAVVRAFSWCMARLVAAGLFVIGFIPYSLVMRLVGFDPLKRDLDEGTETYWNRSKSNNDTPQEFLKQY